MWLALELRNIQRILVVKPLEICQLEDQEGNGRTIVRWMVRKLVGIGVECNWFWIMFSSGPWVLGV
jgi:hypothetical protein